MLNELMAGFPVFIFFSLLSFTWGASIGSFLNVCIYRIPRGFSVVKPRSHCPLCNKAIPWYHNIPILSYFLLRGKCCYCSGPISPRYALVETLTAFLFLMVWLKFDLIAGPRPLELQPVTDWKLVPIYWLMISGLILGTFVDFEFMIIPDRVTIGGVVAGILLSLIVPSMHETQSIWMSLFFSALGASIGWGILKFVAVAGRIIFKKDAMGLGDVKLIAGIGAFLGWKAVLFTIMMSSLFGSVVGIVLVLSGRREMQSRIPYGPYIALAAIVWIFWGPAMVEAYFNLLTPAAPLPPPVRYF